MKNPFIHAERMECRATNRGSSALSGQVRAKFTLIELLVVIAIISILMAMLLPILKAAKTLSISSVCRGNLRQNGLAIYNYATDYAGWTPGQPGGLFDCVFSPPSYASSYTSYLTDYAGVKVNVFGPNNNFGEFAKEDNVACCPARYGSPTWVNAVNDSRWNKTASSYIYPGFGWSDRTTGSDPVGYIKLEKLASDATINNRPYKKILMADKCIYPNYYNDAMNNHLTGGNFMYGDLHAEWFSYKNGVKMENGTWWGQFFPSYTLLPDRSENSILSGFRTDGISFTWIGYSYDKEFH